MIDETVEQIQEMRTQSASIVAVNAAKALDELIDREYHTVEEFMHSLVSNSRALQQANMSHAMLYTTQQRIIAEVNEADPETVDEAKKRLHLVIRDLVERIESSKQEAAENAASLIEDGDVLLTHESSSTVMATLDHAVEAGKGFELFVTESRPRFLGRRTARRLATRDGVDVTLIVDNAAGVYLSECDRVLTGMNCIINEIVYNRVGTYSLATTATCEGVPVTVVGSASKFIGSGFEFRNRFGPSSEVMLEPAEGFDIANPAYDATPTRYLDTIVTEDGIMEF